MRRLVYVPIVHDEADLGMAGPTLLAETVRLAGAGRWAAHKEILARYWTEIAAYLRTLPACQLRLYQDGLPVAGSMGKAVVEEAASRGSRNYQVLHALIQEGGELRPAEDPELLWQERTRVVAATSASPARRQLGADRPPPNSRGRLLRARDAFIANTVNNTLTQGEIGVLFLGAEHRVTARLASDIAVQTLKEPEQVRSYVNALLHPGHDRELDKLAAYLAAPIGTSLEGTPPRASERLS
jgi:hypothetical protein